MASKSRRRLVIDASVARAAGGEDATDPVSKSCRDFLTAVMTVCHRLVMTDAIQDEWKDHRSGFSMRWQSRMYGRRKVDRLRVEQVKLLREAIEDNPNPNSREKLSKDAHLIEAALNTDRCVVSLDDQARDLFCQASSTVGALRRVSWVNPAKAHDSGIEWLKNGARAEKTRLLREEQ